MFDPTAPRQHAYTNVFARQEVADSYDDYYRTDMGKQVDQLEKSIFSDLLQHVPRGPMLELGCGTGHWTLYLLEQGFSVTGIDISEAMLRIAAEKQINADLFLADAQQLPFQNESFPAISTITMLAFVEDQDRVLQEMYRVLQPGGWLLIGALNAHSVLGLTINHDENFRHARFMNPEELSTKLERFGTPAMQFCVHLTHDFRLVDGTPEAEYVHPVFMAAAVQKIR